MTTIKQIALIIVLTLCPAFWSTARAQMSALDMAIDSDQVRFAATNGQEMRVEVYAPSGEMIFNSGAVTGQGVVWKMQTVEGQRVGDGVYLARVSVSEASGKIRKRIEQITVHSERQQEESALAQAPNAVEVTITGSGTSGTIAKFTGAGTIGDSVITENANRIGISTTGAPTAKLHINGGQPAASANNGTNATTLLQTSGGKGGNTTGSGKDGGKGASISLVAGNGGNAAAGGFNGDGGSITLQPGATGTGGTGGLVGNVLLAPTAGQVGIGTNNPGSKLFVSDTSTGAVIYGQNKGSGSGVVGYSSGGGPGVTGGSTGGTGVYGSTASSYGVHGNASSGDGVHGDATSGIGVSGYSVSGKGVFGSSSSGYAGYFDGKVGITGSLGFGSTTRQMLNLYNATYGIGVQTNTLYSRTNVGFAWYKGGTHSVAQNDPGGGKLLMRVDSLGNVFATSFNPSSDLHAKANFSNINSRSILTRLASLPIQTWSYKGEETSVHHIGPTAQDFRAAFNLGADDKHIATVDADGVALAAIQALYQMMQEKDRRLEQQSRQIEQLQVRLSRVECTVKKRRTRKN